ncbi:MAG: YfhO family protein, partial [Candidatus Levybacteria bacterium]|nr:YfhO family protein [Candidatus Levybacteria bacterium]
FISTLPIPIISTSPPSRIFVITTFSIAILAGYGFDNWILYKENLRKLLFRILPFLLLIFIIFTATFSFYLLKLSCNNAFIQNCRLIGLRNTILEIFIFGIFIVLFLLYLKIRKRYIPFIIIFLILLIGGYNSYKFLPFSKKETLLPIHPLINAIKENSDNNRVFGLGEGNIKTNFATFFRFYDPNYFDPLHNRRYNELITFSNSGTLSKSLSRSDIEIATDINLTSEKQERRSRLLNILGVKNIIFSKQEAPKVDSENIVWQDKNWYLLRNNNAMPRTYFVSTYYLMNDDKLILKKLFDASFDPKTSVILEKPLLTPSNNDAANGKVEIINYQENEVTLNTKNNNNAILILTDNFYPGWKGYVDGKETKIYRANYTFRAIEVPSGKHLIRFSYAPESFKIGVILSLISITLYIMIIIRIKLSKKNND